MPTYGFRCDNCTTEFEKFLKISEMDNPLGEPCPKCKTEGKVARTVMGATYAFMTPESLGRRKAPQEFRDYMKAVKRANPGCLIKDR